MNTKSKGIALLLNFFFGAVGIHQFYLGNTNKGLMYFLFSWTGIPAILAIIDLFVLLFMEDGEFHLRYNTFR
ncbi:MAG: TM2 domain-containing protein [Brevinema sp.]